MRVIALNAVVSKIHIFLILLAFIGSMLIIPFLSIGILLQCLLLVFVLGYGWYCLMPSSSVKFSLRGHDWLVHDGFHDRSAILLGCSTVTALASVLCFRTIDTGKTYFCIVFYDALSADDYRYLKVNARFGRI